MRTTTTRTIEVYREHGDPRVIVRAIDDGRLGYALHRDALYEVDSLVVTVDGDGDVDAQVNVRKLRKNGTRPARVTYTERLYGPIEVVEVCEEVRS